MSTSTESGPTPDDTVGQRPQRSSGVSGAWTNAPGWYPDPQGGQVLRWWDGWRWTASTTPLAAPTPTAATKPVARQNAARIAGAGMAAAGLLAAVGASMAWVVVRAPFVGQLTKTGLEGDGLITGLIGVALIIIGAVGFFQQRLPTPLIIATGVLSVVMLAIAGYDAADVHNTVSSSSSDLVQGDVGGGLWVTFLAAFVGIAASVFAAARARGSAARPTG